MKESLRVRLRRQQVDRGGGNKRKREKQTGREKAWTAGGGGV